MEKRITMDFVMEILLQLSKGLGKNIRCNVVIILQQNYNDIFYKKLQLLQIY